MGREGDRAQLDDLADDPPETAARLLGLLRRYRDEGRSRPVR